MNKGLTAKEMEAGYQLCLKREYDRERKRKATKQGAFEASFVHFDFEKEESRERERSTSWLSDNGRGARRIYRALDPKKAKPTREQLIDRAKHRIARHNKECLPVFWLILKNGSNRKESIWELTKYLQQKKRDKKRSQRPSTGTA